MGGLSTLISSSAERNKLGRLIRKSPSPSLARTNLIRLIENSSPKSLKRVPFDYFLPLLRLLGGSAYLSDILIRQGKDWPELFLKQVNTVQKTVADHLAELAPVICAAMPAERLAQLLRQHKQREFLRIGARDLPPSVPVEETMRELCALAEASQIGRAHV